MYREYHEHNTHIRQLQSFHELLAEESVVMEALRLDLASMSVGGDKKVALVTGATGSFLETMSHSAKLKYNDIARAET